MTRSPQKIIINQMYEALKDFSFNDAKPFRFITYRTSTSKRDTYGKGKD